MFGVAAMIMMPMLVQCFLILMIRRTLTILAEKLLYHISLVFHRPITVLPVTVTAFTWVKQVVNLTSGFSRISQIRNTTIATWDILPIIILLIMAAISVLT